MSALSSPLISLHLAAPCTIYACNDCSQFLHLCILPAKIAKLDALDDELLSQEGDEDLKVIEGDTTDASPTPRKRTGRKRKLPGVNVKTEKEDITPMNIRPLKCEESKSITLSQRNVKKVSQLHCSEEYCVLPEFCQCAQLHPIYENTANA